MTAQLVTSKSLRTTFTTALLLTGSVNQAETAMLHGTRSVNACAASEEELLRNTAAAAIESQHWHPRQRPEEIAQASSLLPLELQRVLQLTPDLRQCFVLRLLMAMSRESCARLLDLDVSAVDRDTCLAVQALARIVQAEENR
jgi:DNA-directed RNA polymerase specialized sigma24 family protein